METLGHFYIVQAGTLDREFYQQVKVVNDTADRYKYLCHIHIPYLNVEINEATKRRRRRKKAEEESSEGTTFVICCTLLFSTLALNSY